MHIFLKSGWVEFLKILSLHRSHGRLLAILINKRRRIMVCFCAWSAHMLIYGKIDPSVKRQIRKGMIPPLHVVEDFMLALMSTNDGMEKLVMI